MSASSVRPTQRPSAAPAGKFGAPQPRRRPPVVKIVLALGLLAGVATATVWEFAASAPSEIATPKPALPAPAPAPAPAPTATAPTPATPAATTPDTQRMAISPPPGGMPMLPVPPELCSDPKNASSGSSLALFQQTPPTKGLPPAGPTTRVPVNSVDLFSGKPISYMSPKLEYKGYTVSFCCNNSIGYMGGWEALTEAEKDTYVRSFLK